MQLGFTLKDLVRCVGLALLVAAVCSAAFGIPGLYIRKYVVPPEGVLRPTDPASPLDVFGTRLSQATSPACCTGFVLSLPIFIALTIRRHRRSARQDPGEDDPQPT
jgi:hypothetical protein